MAARLYSDFLYLRNPRTEVKHIIHPGDAKLAEATLGRFERQGWWAQLKLNGTRNGIYIPPKRKDITAWNRHDEKQKQWAFTPETSALFRKIRGTKWNVIDGELMHAKTTHIKDVNYLYDILVHNGKHLVGTTYAERYKILESLWPKQEEKLGYWVLDEHVWLARNYTSGFVDLYKQIADIPEVEGLVLKNPLGIYYTWDARSWMIKVRRK